MTKEEKIEALRKELIDALFTVPLGETVNIDVILDKMDKLEPFSDFDVEEGLQKFKEKYRNLYEEMHPLTKQKVRTYHKNRKGRCRKTVGPSMITEKK